MPMAWRAVDAYLTSCRFGIGVGWLLRLWQCPKAQCNKAAMPSTAKLKTAVQNGRRNWQRRNRSAKRQTRLAAPESQCQSGSSKGSRNHNARNGNAKTDSPEGGQNRQ